MMMTYNVTYYRYGKPTDSDQHVGERYLAELAATLRPGEEARATCLQDRQFDRVILPAAKPRAPVVVREFVGGGKWVEKTL